MKEGLYISKTEIKSAMDRWYSFNRTTDNMIKTAVEHWNVDQQTLDSMLNVAESRWTGHDEYRNTAECAESLARNFWMKSVGREMNF